MTDRKLVWLHGAIKTPPFSDGARRTAGFLLRLVQMGRSLSMPDSRPMPGIGARCHELRIRDHLKRVRWRVIYRIDADAVIIGDVFAKKTPGTPHGVMESCSKRFGIYDQTIA
jgi:phage-related protein